MTISFDAYHERIKQLVDEPTSAHMLACFALALCGEDDFSLLALGILGASDRDMAMQLMDLWMTEGQTEEERQACIAILKPLALAPSTKQVH